MRSLALLPQFTMRRATSIAVALHVLLHASVIAPADAQSCPVWELVAPNITGAVSGNQFNTVHQSVSLTYDGGLVGVGEPGFSSRGRARVYDLIGSSWTQIGADIVGSSGSALGVSVSLEESVTTGSKYVQDVLHENTLNSCCCCSTTPQTHRSRHSGFAQEHLLLLQVADF